MKKTLFLISILLLVHTSLHAQESWQGILSGQQVSTIKAIQHNIWIGTKNGGLIVINKQTNQTTYYNKVNSKLPSNTITSIDESSMGIVWICTSSGSVRIDNGVWEIYQSQSSEIPADELYVSHIDKQGNLWLGGTNILIKYDNKNWKSFDHNKKELPLYGVSDIKSDQNGVVWLAGLGGIVSIDTKDSMTYYTSSNSNLPGFLNFKLLIDNDNKVWASYKLDYESGFVLLQGSVLKKYQINYEAYINSMYCDQDGVFWIGTSKGLYSFKNDTLIGVNLPIICEVNTIDFDEDDVMWLGTSKGLLSFANESWKNHETSQYGKFDSPINQITEINGEITIATEGSIYGWVNNGLTNLSEEVYNIYGINHITTDLSGRIWCATYRLGGSLLVGPYEFDGTNWIRHNVRDMGKDYHLVIDIAVDKFNNKWFSFNSFGNGFCLARYNDFYWTFYSKNNHLFEPYVRSLATDVEGFVWAASPDGLGFFDGNNWLLLTTDNSDFPSNNIQLVKYDKQSKLILIANTDGILSTYDGNSWSQYDPRYSGLEFDWINDMISDRNGDLWIATNKGLIKYDNLGQWKYFNSLNSPLSEDQVMSVYVDAENTKWINLRYSILLLNDPVLAGLQDYPLIYPNPASHQATIAFSLEAKEKVQIRILDISGKMIDVVLNEILEAGDYYKNHNCSELRNGTYFYQIQIGDRTTTSKLVVINNN
ncbi:MAG: T9SS type A sorting domain-containing protein [Bacteroidetes bacterium]|nr:T9SS type A sorting domain-containing protein [Bacteroidota bacterium]